MSFRLTELDEEVFSTSAGGKFKVDLSANRGQVSVLSARYGSQNNTGSPLDFNVEAGANDLIIVFQATNSDALIRLDELDGAKKQRLTTRPAFDTSMSIEIQTLVAAAAVKKVAIRKASAKKAPARKRGQ